MGISLNDHERRIKNIEGQLPDIQNRINNIMANAKQWEIVTLNMASHSTHNSNNYAFHDSKYNNWNYLVIRIDCRTKEYPRYSRNYNSSYLHGDMSRALNLSFSRSGNKISVNGIGVSSSTMTVLFYK